MLRRQHYRTYNILLITLLEEERDARAKIHLIFRQRFGKSGPTVASLDSSVRVDAWSMKPCNSLHRANSRPLRLSVRRSPWLCFGLAASMESVCRCPRNAVPRCPSIEQVGVKVGLRRSDLAQIVVEPSPAAAPNKRPWLFGAAGAAGLKVRCGHDGTLREALMRIN